jgi:hypothetical protein
MVEWLRAMGRKVKKLVKSIVRFFGYGIRKIAPLHPAGITGFLDSEFDVAAEMANSG